MNDLDLRYVVFGCLTVLFVGMSSASVSVSPSNYSFSGVAGDSFSQEVTVSYSGDSIFAGHLVSSVVAEDTNSTGVDVSYTGNGFVLYPGQSSSVIINVDTVSALKPDNFSIESRVMGADIARDDSSVNRDVVRTVEKVVEDTSSSGEAVERLRQELDDAREGLNNSRGRLDDLNQSVHNYNNSLSEARKEINQLERVVDRLNQSSNSTGETDVNPDTSSRAKEVYFILGMVSALTVGIVAVIVNR